MQNNSEIQRPPKPNWRNEITIPTESRDLINEDSYNFTLDTSVAESSDPKPPTEYSTPTEEYLQMTKQLIESRSLPSRTTKTLKQLYVKYKSINDYGSTIVASDQSIQAEKEADKQKRSARSRMQLNPFRTIFLRRSEPMPSASKYDKRPTAPSMDVKKSAKLDQEESSRSTESPFDDFVMPWYGLQDFMFGRPCDPDLIKIDNVFSDFTLRDFVVLAAFVAVASAGGPAAYDIAASSGDLSSIGFTQESTQKGYGGQNVISSYTKSDDSAHSYVRVSSQSIGNDALLKYDVAHAPIVKTAYAAQTYIAPTATPLIAKSYAEPYSYGAPLLAKSYASPYSYSAPLFTKSYAAPSYSYSAPLLTKSYAAPYSYSAPLLTKSYAAPYSYSAPLLTKTYAAPAPIIAKAAIAAPAPLISKAYATPLLAKSYEYASPAPLVAKSALIAPAQGYAASYAAAPLLAKTYAAAPLVTKLAHEYSPEAHLISKNYGYEAAAPVVHTVFNGLGTSYSW